MHDQFLNRKIILIAFVVSISACLQIFKDQFIYWRVDIFPEIWRLWTAHWVHVGWIHFALNMLAFMCLPFIFPRARVWHFVALLLILPPLISLSFYYFLADIEAYAGLYSSTLDRSVATAALGATSVLLILTGSGQAYARGNIMDP
jgi:membrane associated rhomboid family serine protease